MTPTLWWHGSRAPLDTIAWNHPLQGGLHLGTQSQALLRGPILTPFVLYAGNRLRRVRDAGGGWSQKARDARARGFDALIYLNRHELVNSPVGLDWDALDAAPDSVFRRAVPDATDSLLILRQGVARRLSPSEACSWATAPAVLCPLPA